MYWTILDSTDRAPALENLPQQKQHSTDDAVDRGIDVHHVEGTLVVASQDVTGKGLPMVEIMSLMLYIECTRNQPHTGSVRPRLLALMEN